MIVMLIPTGGADFLGWSEGPPIRSLNFSDGDVDVDVDVDGDVDGDGDGDGDGKAPPYQVFCLFWGSWHLRDVKRVLTAG